MHRAKLTFTLLLGLVLGAAGVLRGQEADTLFVFAVPVEMQTLSPEVARVFVDCYLAHHYTTGAVDTIGFARGEALLEPRRFGGFVSDVVGVAFTLSDVQGQPRAPSENYCWLVLRGSDGSEWRPTSLNDERSSTSSVPEWARFLDTDDTGNPTIVSTNFHSFSGDRMVALWTAANARRNQ